MLAIYAPIVRETAISFELEPPSDDEFRRRINSTVESLPWLLCESEDEILGYAHAGRFRARAAYQRSVEVSVYVDSRFRRRGVARALYTPLLEGLRVLGYYNAYAVIALPNPVSVALHEGLGFKPVGVYPSVGFKLGQWHDLGIWQLALQKHNSSPAPPRLLGDVLNTPEWRQAIQKGVTLLEKRGID